MTVCLGVSFWKSLSSRALFGYDRAASKRCGDRSPKRGMGIDAGAGLGRLRCEHRPEPELDGLCRAAVGMADRAQLAGELDLAETGEWTP